MTRARLALVPVAVVLAAAAACRSAAPATARAPIENRSGGDAGGRRVTAYANAPLTATSLAGFLSWRFAAQLDEGTFVAEYNDTEREVLDELRTMGIHDIHQLAAIIPDDFERRGAGEFVPEDPANIPGLVRDFMMIHDAHRYFRDAWKDRWQSILPANVSALRAYVTDFEPFYQAQVLTAEEVREAPEPPPPLR